MYLSYVHISAPLCRTVAYQKNFFHRCVLCSSNFPSAVTNATSLKQFTNALARVDLTNYLPWCNEVHLNYVKCIIVYTHITLALYRLD